MEWSIGEENIRYTAELSDNEGEMTVNSVKKEDEEIPISDISISYNSNLDQFLVNIDKISKLAHVVKVKDSYWIHLDGRIHIVNLHEIGYSNQKQSEGSLVAPMPGTIIEILVKKGQRVRKGQSLMVMEAMKMEHKVSAPSSGKIKNILVSKGEQVENGQTLVVLD